jgi:ATP-dependent DNA helicase RecG
MYLEELQKLISRGESETLEFKKSTGQRTEAAKTVCALLNGLGGFVIFGVTDQGEMVGQQTGSKTLEDIISEIKRIEPPAFPDIETVALSNQNALIVIRVPGKLGTYMYDNRAYIRYGSTTQIMPREECERRVLEKFHSQRRWENETVPAGVTIKDLDEEAIQKTLFQAVQLGRMKKPILSDIPSILRGFGVMDGERLMNAAAALFGRSDRLQSLYPQLAVRLARFRGTDRVSGFEDNREYAGHVFDLLKRGESFLLDHTPISGFVSGKLAREDRPVYHPIATREALANAFCHRDYAAPGGAVAVAMYNDRLEIINPGILNFDITPEKLAKPHESKPWNPIIANVFYRSGIIEKWGSGTLNMILRCKQNGNPLPRWEVRDRSVIVTIFPALIRAKRPESGPESRPGSRPESLEQEILLSLRKTPLSRSEIAKKMGHRTISGGLKQTLYRLLDQGKISLTIPERPNSRLQKYQIALNGQLEAQSRPFRAEKAELSVECGKELAAPIRSGESPPFTEEFFKDL